MYIDEIEVEQFRTFRKAKTAFVHPDRQKGDALDVPVPKIKNVNLLLGDNGQGKTTLLKAIALAALGPAVSSSGIFPYRLVRREPRPPSGNKAAPSEGQLAQIRATFRIHEQDHAKQTGPLHSAVDVRRSLDLERLEWVGEDNPAWEAIFSAESDALFFVGYGATRRVESRENFDPGSRSARTFARAQRVQSLFEDTYSLVPLTSWLPAYEKQNKGRYVQAVDLIGKLTGRGSYRFTGEMDGGEYLFARGRSLVPFPALSDGYRAFLGWVGDLIYHVCTTCPPGKKLVDNQGIVMVDEIDLHLHPSWQMHVLPTLARALPRIQFIVTSHSPLVVGSLEWSNIIVMRPGTAQSSSLARVRSAVHGLDADQVLLTDFFGLESTRAPSQNRALKELTLKARTGDSDAAQALLEQMSKGTEPGA